MKVTKITSKKPRLLSADTIFFAVLYHCIQTACEIFLGEKVYIIF